MLNTVMVVIVCSLPSGFKDEPSLKHCVEHVLRSTEYFKNENYCWELAKVRGDEITSQIITGRWGKGKFFYRVECVDNKQT